MNGRKILVAALILGALTSPASADLDFRIAQNCELKEEPVFSMYSKTGGNIGSPDYYKWKICAKDIEYAKIRDSCQQGENSLISMFQKDDSHASINQEYRWDVCVPRVRTNLTQSCGNPIASMNSKTDSHMAEPGYYKWQLCPFYGKPDNVTVEMEFDAGDVYIDDTEAVERTYNPIELSYPYIVSDQPAGLVSYGKLIHIDYETQGSSDIFRIMQSAESSSVLVPFTQGGHQEMEDEEEDIRNSEFLNRNSPNFGFAPVESPKVTARKQFEYVVHGFEDVETGRTELSVRNKVNNNETTEIILTPLG